MPFPELAPKCLQQTALHTEDSNRRKGLWKQCGLAIVPPAWQGLGREQARLSHWIIPTHPRVTLHAETLLLSACSAVTGCLQQADSTSVQLCYQLGEIEEPPRGWRMEKCCLPAFRCWMGRSNGYRVGNMDREVISSLFGQWQGQRR